MKTLAEAREAVRYAIDDASGILARVPYPWLEAHVTALKHAAALLAGLEWLPIETAPEFDVVELLCDCPLYGEYICTATLTEQEKPPHEMIWVDPGGDAICSKGASYAKAWRPRSYAKRPTPPAAGG